MSPAAAAAFRPIAELSHNWPRLRTFGGQSLDTARPLPAQQNHFCLFGTVRCTIILHPKRYLVVSYELLTIDNGEQGVRLLNRRVAAGTGTIGGWRTVLRATCGTALVSLGCAVCQAQTLQVGPGETATNDATLTSNSSSTPVVRMTGASTFTNTGTITASSSSGPAITGDGGDQSVTLESGSVIGRVNLGAGDDRFVMSGGTLNGTFNGGAGNDTATFRNLASGNFGKATFMSGDATLTSNDTVIFDSTDIISRRLSGWNNISLTNGSTMKMDSDLTLVNGTLTIDATSKLFAGNGALSTIQAAPGGTLTVINAGGISLKTGEDVATDTLTIRGNYVGQNGYLNLHTVLGADGSPSDRLIIDGGTVSGTTRIDIQNVGGLGAQTTGNGIEVVSAINGGTTTARTTGTGFVLEGEHVDAGAFEYRLFASDQTGTSESWFLRSQASTQTGTPGNPDNPGSEPAAVAYRVEVPLLASLANNLLQGDLDFLGTYHKRMGDEGGTVAQGFTTPGRIWALGIFRDGRSQQRGDARPETDGHVYGFKAGIDLFRYGNASGHHDLGVYGGYTDGKLSVRGFASGLENQYVGRLEPNSTYAGLYWSYLGNNGFYFDTVVQHSWYGGRAGAVNGGRVAIDGTSILASVETGFGVALSPGWTIEPQLQVIAQGVSIGDVAIPNALVRQNSDGKITGRIGLRAKGRFDTASGSVQPYIRANVWKSFAATDRTTFVTPAANTIIATRNAALWGDAGVGLTWAFNDRIALYGEVDHRFSLDERRATVGRSTGGSVGVKFAL